MSSGLRYTGASERMPIMASLFGVTFMLRSFRVSAKVESMGSVLQMKTVSI
jgi:hypothetical protein